MIGSRQPPRVSADPVAGNSVGKATPLVGRNSCERTLDFECSECTELDPGAGRARRVIETHALRGANARLTSLPSKSRRHAGC